MMFIVAFKITQLTAQFNMYSNMTPSEKESQTILPHNTNGKDDVISEASSLQFYHIEWDDRQLEPAQSTNFSFKDSLPQVNKSNQLK